MAVMNLVSPVRRSQWSASRSLRRRSTAYTLTVGEDVDTLEETFSETMDTKVSPKFFLRKKIIFLGSYL